MKKLTIILTACAITLFLFSCQKDKEGLVDTGTAVVKNEEQKAITNNADWNAFISRVEKNKVTKADSAYITTRMANYARGCNYPAPDLQGSGGYLYFNSTAYLGVDMSTLWFHYPVAPQLSMTGLVIFQVKYTKNGQQTIKTAFAVAKKLADPGDIGSLSINGLQIDYNTQWTAETWSLSICETRHLLRTYGPYVPLPTFQASQKVAIGILAEHPEFVKNK